MGDNILEYSFEDLEINDELLRGIFAYGFENPSNIQHKSIPIINKGKDLIAQSQSGTGKTGAFTIGILNKLDVSLQRTQFIIVTPTHELAKQIYDTFCSLLQTHNVNVKTGKFGANMEINLINEGPVTIILDSNNK